MEYLLISLAAVCSALSLSTSKFYSKVSPKGIVWLLMYTYLSDALTLVGLFIMNGFKVTLNPYGVGMAAILSVFIITYCLLGIFVSAKAGAGIYTTFVSVGGMLVPYVFGIAFLHERVTPWGIIGVVVLIAAILFLSFDPEKPGSNRDKNAHARAERKLALFLAVLVFIFNGACTIVIKLHQISPKAIPSTDFLIATQMVGVGLLTLVFCVLVPVTLVRRKRAGRKDGAAGPNSGKMLPSPATANGNAAAGATRTLAMSVLLAVLACLMRAVFNGGGTLLQLKAATTLPASAQFPFTAGGSILIGTILAAVIYREKITKLTVCSLILMLCGTVLFVF